MRAGKRDKRITIEARLDNASDAYGKPAEVWRPFVTVWANVEETPADERTKAPQVLPVRRAVFTVRNQWPITAHNRIRYDGAVWNVTGIARVGPDLQLTGEAVEVR